ncbi:DNA recombination protein RmuC [Methylocella sp.]|uniref:DNA recombination protein RmuC n=1 Tax=Methylocella sp. TaxID=1978226 RepID=UPI0037844049
MDPILLDRFAVWLNGAPPGVAQGLVAGAALSALALGLAALARRSAGARRARELEAAMSAMARQNAEFSGRMRAFCETVGARQSDLARFVAARLDAVSARVGADVETSGRAAGEQLARLNERIAVIDAAQARLTRLSQEVVGLKEILGDKQTRGAFGQGRMEAIVRDALPPSAYAFQHRLSTGVRPDCVVRLPGDPRLLVIDAKFPLEGLAAFREAQTADARRAAATRARADLAKHVRDIAERYFVPHETQDVALMFVPAESLFADINEHFPEVARNAHRRRVFIVSPSLLMMATQLLQALARDARMREEAHLIQAETRRLVAEVERLRAGARKLDAHFNAAHADLAQILAGAERVARAGARIEDMEFDAPRDGPTMKAAE